MLDSQEVARLARSLRKLLEDVQEDTTRNTRRIKDAIGIAKQIETMAKNVRADEGSYKRSRLTLLEDLPAYSRQQRRHTSKPTTEQRQIDQEDIEVQRTIDKCKHSVSHLYKRIKFMVEARNPYEGRIREYKEYLKTKQKSPQPQPQESRPQKEMPSRQPLKEQSPVADRNRTPTANKRARNQQKDSMDIQSLDADILRLTKLIHGLAKDQR